MISSLREQLIRKNQTEFKDLYQSFRWPVEEETRTAAEHRQALLSALESRIQVSAKGTKPHLGDLSPGCRLCMQGVWSCLFVNGRCNCSCFYCPSEQNARDLPMTNRVTFARPREYVDYLERFGFQGVGLSGGEPLMTFETTLKFASAIKRRFGDKVFVWLYTNGTLVDEDKLGKLADAGLDEIRFDIGATGYDLSRAASAVGTISTVTVEIPAVPEDMALVKKAIPAMKDAGIDHLNLHQLRVTPFNAPKLVRRGYSFLHGDKVTVLESELTALELMQFSADQVGLPVNYCSFAFRNRFQNAAAKIRSGNLVRKGHESLTETGLIRSLALKGPVDLLKRQAEALASSGAGQDLWSLASGGSELLFHPDLWAWIDVTSQELTITYLASTITPNLSYFNPFKEIRLSPGRSIYVERSRTGHPIRLCGQDIDLFHDRFLKGDSSLPVPMNEGWARLTLCEEIPSGLQEYF